MRRQVFTAMGLALAVLAAGAAAPAVPKLSKKERAERLRALPEEERHWLEELVRPIILPDEEDFFLLLSQPHEREIFKEEFWKRREREGLAFPLGRGYRQRYEEFLRTADQKYDGRREDAGRMVIARGEPASIDQLLDCRDMFRDLEIWSYRRTAGGDAGGLRYFFYRTTPASARKLWDVTVPSTDVFQPGSCRKQFSELFLECSPQKNDPCMVPNCSAACGVYQVYEEIQARQGSGLGGTFESATTLAAPTVPLEDLETLAGRFPGIRNPQATPIAVEGPEPATMGSPAAAPAPPRLHLSFEEVRERILRLEPKYREWLDLAVPLLREEELISFLQMTEREKDEFIRAFWKRRSK